MILATGNFSERRPCTARYHHAHLFSEHNNDGETTSLAKWSNDSRKQEERWLCWCPRVNIFGWWWTNKIAGSIHNNNEDRWCCPSSKAVEW